MSEKPPADPSDPDAPSAREQRLAEALRANLKRRKTAKKPEKDARKP